jgi:hypothetical protein
MAAKKIEIPFVIWTFQRTGGTNLNRHLNRLSIHDKFQDEPFNGPREFGSLTKAWKRTKDASALRDGMDKVCAQRKNIKHCVEQVPWAVNKALLDAAHVQGYAPIFLYRENPLQRLLSMEYAKRTKSWGPSSTLEDGQDAVAFDAPLDAEALAGHEDRLNERLNRIWTLLSDAKAAPVAISYEEIYAKGLDQAHHALQRVFDRLGVQTSEALEEAIRGTGDQKTRDRYGRFKGIATLQEQLDNLQPLIFAPGRRGQAVGPIAG